ncbi:MAG: hypothetical protein JOZ15_11715 [Acidobacteria bacterium]|nr:hypothetical protein [Acidobacteriota bacterium]
MGRFAPPPLALTAPLLTPPILLTPPTLLTLLTLLALPLAPPAAGALPPGPQLVVEAPAALGRVAARVRAIEPGAFSEVMSLVGLADPGPPILVRLEPEGGGPARAVPPWIAGFAVPETATIVIFPARAPSYPDSSLDDLLRHEVAHVLAARAAGGRSLPRWFDEGLAMIAGGTWGADDRARFLLELMVEPGVPLAGLDSRFAGSQRQVAGAYAVAGAFVREQVQRHGAGAPGRILAAVAAGAPFPEAFQAGTGVPLDAAETEFWRRHSLQRWLPLATSSTALWLGITLLALAAAHRRRRRAAALRAQWSQEDDGPPPRPLDGDPAG